jgi:hypothetical protein
MVLLFKGYWFYVLAIRIASIKHLQNSLTLFSRDDRGIRKSVLPIIDFNFQ